MLIYLNFYFLSNASCSIALKFCNTFLSDFGDSVFNTIRYWLYGLSVVAKKTPRPNLVWWRGDVVLLFGQEISFMEYRKKVYQKVLHLENFVLEEVLFGLFTMEQLESLFRIGNLTDLGDELTEGYGIIADTTNPLMNTEESNLFFKKLFAEKKLGFRPDSDGGIIFDQFEGVKWLSCIHEAYKSLVPACHTLVVAGRGTEWLHVRPTNGIRGRRGVMFDSEALTGAFDTEYHKGLALTGTNKHNRRYMPYEVFRILYLLLRVVRPIELIILFGTIVTDMTKVKTIQSYNNHIFASLGKE